MTDTIQNGLSSEQQHDPETGEVRPPISTRAVANMPPRKHWDRLEGLIIRERPEDDAKALAQSQYDLAFLSAQIEIVPVLEAEAKATVPTKTGPGFSYSYASLGQILLHVRPILHKHGFTMKQGTGRIHKMGLDGGNMLYLPVYTKLTYVGDGTSETFVMEMPLPKLDPQAIGSATSYAKRYLLLGTFGIATADDDAISAMTQRTISKDDESEHVAAAIEKIKACKTIDDMQKWAKQAKEGLSGLSVEAWDKMKAAYADHKADLQDSQAVPAEVKPAKKEKAS